MEYGGSDVIYGESDVIYDLSHMGNGQQCTVCWPKWKYGGCGGPILLHALMLVNMSLAC